MLSEVTAQSALSALTLRELASRTHLHFHALLMMLPKLTVQGVVSASTPRIRLDIYLLKLLPEATFEVKFVLSVSTLRELEQTIHLHEPLLKSCVRSLETMPCSKKDLPYAAVIGQQHHILSAR